jgi:hypothetical protein
MITILNRIFPYDISQIIYNIAKNQHLNRILDGKLYLLVLVISKNIYQFKNHLSISFINDADYISIIDVSDRIQSIYNRYIIKYGCKFDEEFKTILQSYCNIMHKEFLNFIETDEKKAKICIEKINILKTYC